jgi:microcystin-dependent protein
LDNIKKINPDVAFAIGSNSNSILSLNGLQEISDPVAKSLANHKGGWLILGGLKEISPEAARSLSHSRCHYLVLSGLKKMSPKIALELSKFNGLNILFYGFNEIDDESAKNIANFKGIIVMWSGSIATIPEGWLLCNGQNGTPDLRSRFVVGAATAGSLLDTGLTVKEFSPTGTKGGVETVTLSIAQMPAHTHSYRADGSALVGSSHEYERNSGSHQEGGVTGSTGGSQPHDNMPPYYALAYIMKK